MKRCPSCYELYGEENKFCELDGEKLFADPVLTTLPAKPKPARRPRRQGELWLMGAVGLVVGLLIATIGIAFFASLPKAETSVVTPSARVVPARSENRARQRQPHWPIASPLFAYESDDAEPEKSESSNEDGTGAGETEHSAKEEVTAGPISTGARTKQKPSDRPLMTLVQMTDGTELEVDAAWKDGNGVWFRRGNLVSHVEGHRVRAITARPANGDAVSQAK